MMSIAKGGALALNSETRFRSPYKFEASILRSVGIPIFVFYMAIVYVLGYIVLYKLKLGRYLFAIGGNRKSTKLAGINVKKYETYAYIISGLLAGLGGVLLTARLNYATPIQDHMNWIQ